MKNSSSVCNANYLEQKLPLRDITEVKAFHDCKFALDNLAVV